MNIDHLKCLDQLEEECWTAQQKITIDWCRLLVKAAMEPAETVERSEPAVLSVLDTTQLSSPHCRHCGRQNNWRD